MSTRKQDRGPSERSKKMLLRHPPWIVLHHEDGTHDHTLPRVAGLSEEEVERFLAALVLGKIMTAVAEQRGLSLSPDTMASSEFADAMREIAPSIALTGDDVERGLEWAVEARLQVALFHSVAGDRDEFVRRYIERVRTFKPQLAEVFLKHAAEIKKSARRWTEQDWTMALIEANTNSSFLQMTLHGFLIPIFRDRKMEFIGTEKLLAMHVQGQAQGQAVFEEAARLMNEVLD
jgi:hypothetical protein